MAEERALHEAKLAKMEAEMKMVFQQKVNEKEAKLKQSEEELYARHREMKEALEKQRIDLEEKKRRLEQGRPLTPEKVRSPAMSRRHPLAQADIDSLDVNSSRRRRRASCAHSLPRRLVTHASLRLTTRLRRSSSSPRLFRRSRSPRSVTPLSPRYLTSAFSRLATDFLPSFAAISSFVFPCATPLPP